MQIEIIFEDKKPTTQQIRKSVIVGMDMISKIATRIEDWSYSVELLPINKLITRERGKRQSLDKLVQAYSSESESIVPITVIPQGNKYLIVDGHHRRQAAKLAGKTYVWCVVIAGETGNFRFKRCKNCGHSANMHGDGTHRFGGEFCQHTEPPNHTYCGCTQLVV